MEKSGIIDSVVNKELGNKFNELRITIYEIG
jgi:hypothetical protein